MPVDSYCREVQFDARKFMVRKGTEAVEQEVEGRKLDYEYAFDKSRGAAAPSNLQVQRNFQNAVLKLGGKVLYDEKEGYYRTTLFLARAGKEIWAEVRTEGGADGDHYYLTIVERGAMKQDIVANAEAMKSGLTETGHAEIAGIFFDFNKAEIKPESQAALDETVKLLRADPALRVWVVGHTDNVGTAEANVKLSSARASAVVAALVKAGIDAKRLAPHGAGPYSPKAANTTEEGRAQNRRVELVAQP